MNCQRLNYLYLKHYRQTSTKDDRLANSPLGVTGAESSFEEGVSLTFDWLV